MQTATSETFADFIRRLASSIAASPAVPVDPLDFLIDGRRPAEGTPDDKNRDDVPKQSGDWRPDTAMALVDLLWFGPEGPVLRQPESRIEVEVFKDRENLDRRPMSQFEAHQGAALARVDPGLDQRGIDPERPSIVSGIHRDRPVRDAGDVMPVIPAVADSESVQRPARVLTRRLSEVTTSSMPAHTARIDQPNFSLPPPIIHRSESIPEDDSTPGGLRDRAFDSSVTPNQEARQAIDDLASRVAQLEAAQFIRGRL